MRPQTITDFVILVIVLMWAASIGVGFIDHKYQVPNTVQMSMGAVAAFLFGNKILNKK